MSISVVTPRDIWEYKDNGEKVLVAKKGDRISLDDAKKYKIVPIAVSEVRSLETK